MIKMVVSDIDDTLLKEGTIEMNPKMYDIVRELKQRDILFVAASGRQYASMRVVFEPVANDMIFIAENGSVIMEQDILSFCDYLEPEIARRVVRQLHTYENGELNLSTPEMLCFEAEGKSWKLVKDGYKAAMDLVPDLIPYCERTNKITIYREYGIPELGKDLRSIFGEDLNVVVSGSCWVDLMNKSGDKGTAVARLQKRFGILPEETMVFGDNCNDIGMLQQATESYAVENAHPDLKAVAKYIVPSYKDEGVIRTIRERLLQD